MVDFYRHQMNINRDIDYYLSHFKTMRTKKFPKWVINYCKQENNGIIDFNAAIMIHAERNKRFLETFEKSLKIFFP